MYALHTVVSKTRSVGMCPKSQCFQCMDEVQVHSEGSWNLIGKTEAQSSQVR